jgi:DinB family protein
VSKARARSSRSAGRAGPGGDGTRAGAFAAPPSLLIDMPFSYYARLNREQKALYKKSDAITEVRLSRPGDLHPLVAALDQALASEERAATQAATERLVHGLTAALGIPSVRVEVLAARPHARWGELHGLYTAERGRTPKIQLWMRTAKQRRVVAFRTFLRTLLHEVGHHVDYTLLGLDDSLHTEGFYKRESSLFHQIHPEATSTLADRLARLERTPRDVAGLLAGRTDAALSRQPAAGAWSARELVAHLRDLEELHETLLHAILAMDEPVLVEIDTERWVEERQYRRQHAGEAWEAFARRRDETLRLIMSLDPARRARAGLHPGRGRMTIEGLVSAIAWHDDHHLDQIRRALEDGPPGPRAPER